jgi:hypothetical protein
LGHQEESIIQERFIGSFHPAPMAIRQLTEVEPILEHRADGVFTQPMLRYLVFVDGNGRVDLGRARLAHGDEVNDVELPIWMAQQVCYQAHTLGIL